MKLPKDRYAYPRAFNPGFFEAPFFSYDGSKKRGKWKIISNGKEFRIGSEYVTFLFRKRKIEFLMVWGRDGESGWGNGFTEWTFKTREEAESTLSYFLKCMELYKIKEMDAKFRRNAKWSA